MENSQALLAAYLRKRGDLVRFFTARTGSAAAAEDLVQDIYLRIQAIEAPPELQSPEAYLYRVGANLMLDRLKIGRRRHAREAAWFRGAVSGDLEPVSEEPLADQVIADRQRLARLIAAVDRLPPRVATAFRLHKFDGLTHTEVAERMGVSRSAVEKYLMTALRRLVAEMQE